jgi:hypothetical protein
MLLTMGGWVGFEFARLKDGYILYIALESEATSGRASLPDYCSPLVPLCLGAVLPRFGKGSKSKE